MLLSSFAPVYGRTLGSVVLLAILGAVVSKLAANSFASPIDTVDQAGGAALGPSAAGCSR